MSREDRRAEDRRRSRFGMALLVLVAVGVSLAVWASAQPASAREEAIKALQVRPGQVDRDQLLYPGRQGDVVVKIQNKNSFDVEVTEIEQIGEIGSDNPGCSPGSIEFTDQTGSWPIAARRTASITLSGSVTMSSSAPQACQGTTFTIPVRVTGLEITDQNSP